MSHSGRNPSTGLRTLPIAGDHRIGAARPAEPQRMFGSRDEAYGGGFEQHGGLDNRAAGEYQGRKIPTLKIIFDVPRSALSLPRRCTWTPAGENRHRLASG